MNKVVVGVLLGVGGSGGVCTVAVARHVPTIRPNVSVAGVPLGGLTVDEARKAVRVWWEQEKLHPLRLRASAIPGDLPDMKPGELGVGIDDAATVARLPVQDGLSEAKSTVTRESFTEEKFEPIFRPNGATPEVLVKLVRQRVGAPRPAKVLFIKGQISKTPEVTPTLLDLNGLVPAVAAALKGGTPVDLPLASEPKKIADDQLAQILEVVAEFHTHFPKRQYNRNQNIKLASSRLNGIILMPGDQLSFNKTVGQRTIKQGFMLAGVYKNGKHDTGIGGGICQVSTTLYNASLYGNLDIVRRSNHSMPVAYVPLGRDATVDYGSLDLVIKNSYSTPIAVTSEFEPGTLTFRILGKRVPGQWVKVVQEGGKSWDRPVQVKQDRSLAPGAKVVVEKGSRGHSIRTYRLVYQGDTVVKKQSLGFSYYGGGDRIIAVGPGAPTPMTTPGQYGARPGGAPVFPRRG